MKTVDATMTVFGVVAATGAVVSLVQHWGDVELFGIFELLLSEYRGFTLLVKTFLVDWWLELIDPTLSIPLWGIDLFILYSLSRSMALRGQIASDNRLWHSDDEGRRKLRVKAFARVAWFAPIAPAAVVDFLVRQWKDTKHAWEEKRELRLRAANGDAPRNWELRVKWLNSRVQKLYVSTAIAFLPLVGALGYFGLNAGVAFAAANS